MKHELPNAQFHDATALVNWQSTVKSPADITLMRRAGHIVERMHEQIHRRFRPGLRKNELVQTSM